MAFKRSLSEEDLTCPICCDIFKDPVILSCSHSLCKVCIETFWHGKLLQQCPMCRRRSVTNPPPSNLALRNLCEGFVQERDFQASVAGELCTAHGERLRQFCLEDREPVCSVCCTSRKHRQHKRCPTEEAASDYRDQLKTTLRDFQQNLSGLHDLKHHYKQIKKQIQWQGYDTEQQIKKVFERLHQFLQDEEKARTAALEEEAKAKRTAVNKKIKEISQKISALEGTVEAIEEAVGSSDVPFLQNIKSTMGRVPCVPAVPEKVPGSLIDVARHLGNLKFEVWQKMWSIAEYSPVILDPNTSQAKLALSEDLTSVVNSTEKHRVPYNPERFIYYPCVLGSQSLHSGLHCWEVDTGDSATWCVGVTTASNQRQGDTFFNGNTWFVKHQGGKYTCHSPDGPGALPVTDRMRVLRVRLDCDGGEVSFSEALSDKHLCSFRHVFTEGVFPFLYNYCKYSPLKILPVKI
ncbi:hypothetical protein ACEWY4_019682 [Coilia grayii]|uniref:Tripartite motif-containing protein 35-like n=1 Tax=Coilia grayii TaxID=363190 RepID=A0ABD1JAT1_9TELE